MLSDAQMRGLAGYLERDGRLVVLGESGTHDERG